MNKCFATFLAVFFMHGISVANAGNFTPYIGVGGGLFSTKYAEVGPLGGLIMKDSTWGTFVKAGADIFDYTGIEIRSGITGKITKNFPAGTLGSIPPLAVSAQLTNFVSYFAKLQYPLTRQVKIYGLVGATSGRISVQRNQGVGGAITTWKTDLSYGSGIEYKFRVRGSIGLEWMKYWTTAPIQAIPPSTSSNSSFSGATLSINKFF